MLDAISKKNFILSTREIDIDTFVNNFENDVTNSQFRMQHYKQYLDKTDHVNKIYSLYQKLFIYYL